MIVYKEVRHAVADVQGRTRERMLTEDRVNETIKLYKSTMRWATRHGIDPASVEVTADGGAVCTTYGWPDPMATYLILGTCGYHVGRYYARRVIRGDNGLVKVSVMAPSGAAPPKLGTLRGYSRDGRWVYANTEVEDVEI